jgi:hemoglobin/transferrin/lactoferrin receptor protein
MDRRLPADAADLFADEPDLAMSRDLRRFGATRPNIRGIEDNRVIQLVDGIRLPNYYNGGGPTNFTMNAPLSVAPDFLKRVEVVRGPSSSLYGSDAIGGVVGFITLDPADLLGTTARNAIRLRATHHDANEGFGLTALGALRGEAAEFLIGVSGVRTKETDNRGDVDTVSATRTRPNPQKTDDGGVLAKLVMRPTAGHKLAAAIEGRELASHTDVLRLSASLPKVTWMQGDDNTRRVRGSLEWEHKPASGFYDRLTARVFRQDADTDNYNFQRRTNTGATCSASSGSGNNCYIEQDFFFTQETTGGGIQLDKMLNAGGLAHLLAFGIDVSRVRTEELRDARIWNQTTGTFTKSLAGDIRQADARNPVGVDFYTQPGRSLSLALQADF